MRVHRMTISGKAKIMEVGYKITHVTCNLLLLDGSLYHPANTNALVVERDHSLLNPSMSASAGKTKPGSVSLIIVVLRF